MDEAEILRRVQQYREKRSLAIERYRLGLEKAVSRYAGSMEFAVTEYERALREMAQKGYK